MREGSLPEGGDAKRLRALAPRTWPRAGDNAQVGGLLASASISVAIGLGFDGESGAGQGTAQCRQQRHGLPAEAAWIIHEYVVLRQKQQPQWRRRGKVSRQLAPGLVCDAEKGECFEQRSVVDAARDWRIRNGHARSARLA